MVQPPKQLIDAFFIIQAHVYDHSVMAGTMTNNNIVKAMISYCSIIWIILAVRDFKSTLVRERVTLRTALVTTSN